MYLDHFGLSEPPFRITPHTEFFFAGANRGATLDALLYAITHDEGIVKVSGEVGSGKTMLCRVLMERLPGHVDIVYLTNPSLSREDIVFAIADELELPLSETMRASAAVRALQDRLIQLHGSGRQVVVLIDEAHAMPLETLEEIRLLSNLETSHRKLLQLVLFGQPELDGVLARPDMRQLRERITHCFELEPLRREDIAHYIDFRMRTAGYRGPSVFLPAGIKLVAQASEGLTRRVNILAEKSLLAAFAEGAHEITPKHVRAAIHDSRYDTLFRRRRRALLVAGGFALVAAAIVTIVLLDFRKGSSPSEAMSTSPAPVTSGTSPTTASGTTMPSSAPESPAAPATSPTALKDAGAVPGKPGPDSRRASADTPAASQDLGVAAEQRLKETREWIDAASGDRWFVQLVAANAGEMEFVRRYLEKADRLLQPERAGLYMAVAGKEKRVGIIYGDFDSQQAAIQAIARLPADLRSSKPFPRQVMRLK